MEEGGGGEKRARVDESTTEEGGSPPKRILSSWQALRNLVRDATVSDITERGFSVTIGDRTYRVEQRALGDVVEAETGASTVVLLCGDDDAALPLSYPLLRIDRRCDLELVRSADRTARTASLRQAFLDATVDVLLAFLQGREYMALLVVCRVGRERSLVKFLVMHLLLRSLVAPAEALRTEEARATRHRRGGQRDAYEEYIARYGTVGDAVYNGFEALREQLVAQLRALVSRPDFRAALSTSVLGGYNGRGEAVNQRFHRSDLVNIAEDTEFYSLVLPDWYRRPPTSATLRALRSIWRAREWSPKRLWARYQLLDPVNEIDWTATDLGWAGLLTGETFALLIYAIWAGDLNAARILAATYDPSGADDDNMAILLHSVADRNAVLGAVINYARLVDEGDLDAMEMFGLVVFNRVLFVWLNSELDMHEAMTANPAAGRIFEAAAALHGLREPAPFSAQR